MKERKEKKAEDKKASILQPLESDFTWYFLSLWNQKDSTRMD